MTQTEYVDAMHKELDQIDTDLAELKDLLKGPDCDSLLKELTDEWIGVKVKVESYLRGLVGVEHE
jgi:hypothetical protein